MNRTSLLFLTIFLLSSCGTVKENYQPSDGHIKNDRPLQEESTIPEPVTLSPALPLPEPEKIESVHTVVVSDVSVKELLFALTRDADINLDIDESVTGNVTINAIEQPFSAILDRIARSANLRYQTQNDVLRVEKDTPFLRNYRIDYLNIARKSETAISVSTELGATGRGGASSESNREGSNSSQTEVTSESTNQFWQTLENNIAAIIAPNQTAQTDSSEESALEEGATESEPEGNSESTGSTLIVNKETGIIAVRATQKQHQAIDEFLLEVTTSAQRQVLIEATIAEVRLNDTYQAGIDWSSIQDYGGGLTQNINQALTDPSLSGFVFQAQDIGGIGDQLNFTLRALETFGDVSIVSSPKVIALNNQTALLKVVDNLVYFTVDVEIEEGEEGEENTVVYESQVHTLPVGFVMTVTPFINQDNAVTLNVRPTISRVVGQARDPNPIFEELGITNEIPVVQVREVESVLKVNSGDVAVIGGLMQDEISEEKNRVPLFGSLPVVGSLFRYENESSIKTELVVFLKPVVVKHASLNADMNTYKAYLPSES